MSLGKAHEAHFSGHHFSEELLNVSFGPPGSLLCPSVISPIPMPLTLGEQLHFNPFSVSLLVLLFLECHVYGTQGYPLSGFFHFIMLFILYIVTCVWSFLAFISKWYSVVWLNHSLFIHSPVVGHILKLLPVSG